MKQELDQKLCEKYPKIFANRYADETTTAMCWGFECRDGWYQLIDTLCDTIQSYIDRNKKYNNIDTPQVTAIQVKEKFGTLRFYYDGGDDVIRGMVWLAENLSAEICENCGNPGELVKSSWVQTLCNTCRNKNG